MEGGGRARVLRFPTDGEDLATWKRVGKGVGGQVFRETFSGLKGWKKRFFFLDRRAISDAMARRHHDSAVNDHIPEDGFMVAMFEYLRFPFLSGASISKGHVLSFQDQIEQNTTRLLPSGQDIPEKTNHQKRVNVEDPKIVATLERKARAAAKKMERQRQGGDGGEGSRPTTKRKKNVSLKDGPAVFGATSSLEPLRTINYTDPSGIAAETAESREDHSPHVSSYGSANPSVHNYFDTHVNEETDTLCLGTSGDQSGRAITNVNTEVVQPSPMHRPTHHSPTTTRSASPSRSIQRVNVKAGESSSRGSLYEESNALTNATALKRAWFSLARGALAQTDILKRFERLQADFDQLSEIHSKCGETVGKLALRIKELEDELARKDSALVYAERLNAERTQERDKLVTQLSKTEMEKFDCVRKLLPTVVELLLQSHEYKKSLFEPFNLAIQARWGKGLSEERSEEDLL
uniref:Uncharacterized protein n=1 Tax=Tanacetum cinerariifolium TaxID=118510 RepID=A0A6L2LC95_TANCI|nr:hypothetical protein [Tanacetum cinerariifolium]